MTVLIGVTTAWSIETWGEQSEHPGGILYNPAHYSNAIYQNGGLPFLIAPPVKVADDQALQVIVEQTLAHLSGLYFSGGGGTKRFRAPDMPGLEEQQPLRYRFEKLLILEAYKRKMPFIGACRGHQMILESLGGNLRKATVTDHQQKDEEKTSHRIEINGNTRLKEVTGLNVWEVNSMHCQIAEEAPPGFIASARSPEGYIEAIEADSEVFQMGFQFHPEVMCEFDQKARTVIRAFIEAAVSYSKKV
ncbi:MAG: gamma-glutamyl-gamma-aminobutyrate hydrolase family protein [Dethiobacteria bacterium]|nr:gamma-glutamyl-gamma-aminobutyrate hydrolase family protein [Dethiobacteria bacterium]